jgi:threonine dehydrogenase-like Zn-dependent dehydrogenase
MRAIIGDGRATACERVPPPVRPPGWVRVRVELAGVCRTDVHAAEGLLALGGRRVLGHELVGEIEETDPRAPLARGARVTASPLLPCGRCAGCRRGRRCASPAMLGVDVDGAFAEQVVLPAACVVPVPPHLSSRRAAYVEPLAAALGVVARAPILPEHSGAVIGAGRIADLTARVLEARGFRSLAAPREGAPLETGSLDFVVEAEGSDAALTEALRVVAPGGVVVLKARPASHLALDVARAVRNDVTLVGAAYGPFEDAVALAASLPLDDLLGDVYPIDRFAAVLELSRARPLGPKLFLSPTEGA